MVASGGSIAFAPLPLIDIGVSGPRFNGGWNPWVVMPGITAGLRELMEGGGVEKKASPGFWERLCGDMGPFIKSWKF